MSPDRTPPFADGETAAEVGPAEALARFDEAMQVVDAVVAVVRSDQWSQASPCPSWSAADVLGHLVWGQHLLAAWSHGQQPPTPADPPRAELEWAHPVMTWTSTRAETRTVMTPEVLSRTVTTRAFGSIRFSTFVATFPFDSLAHAWDLASAVGQEIQLPPGLTAQMLAWGQDNESLLRRPGGLGTARPLPDGSSVQEQFLAFTGRG